MVKAIDKKADFNVPVPELFLRDLVLWIKPFPLLAQSLNINPRTGNTLGNHRPIHSLEWPEDDVLLRSVGSRVA